MILTPQQLGLRLIQKVYPHHCRPTIGWHPREHKWYGCKRYRWEPFDTKEEAIDFAMQGRGSSDYRAWREEMRGVGAVK